MSFDFTSFEQKVSETKSWLADELAKIRSGRVTAGVLDGVQVDVYGSSTPLEQLASVGNEGPRTLRVNVYDTSQTDAIETALQQADLGASIATDESGLRLNFPEMTDENKKQALKRAKGKREEARVSLRREREETLQEIKSQEEDGDISEDDAYRLEDELDEKMQAAKADFEDMLEEKQENLDM